MMPFIRLIDAHEYLKSVMPRFLIKEWISGGEGSYRKIFSHPIYSHVLNDFLKYNNSDMYVGVFHSRSEYDEYAIKMRKSEFWNLALREYPIQPDIENLNFTIGNDD
jgi:hypothetical protein